MALQSETAGFAPRASPCSRVAVLARRRARASPCSRVAVLARRRAHAPGRAVGSSHSVGTASHNYAEAAANHYLATDRNGQPAPSYAGGFTYDLFQPAARAYAWNAM